jgi:hypothetical protein
MVQPTYKEWPRLKAEEKEGRWGSSYHFFLWDIPISMHKFQVNLLRSWKLGSWSLKELDFWCVCACFPFFFPLKFGAEGERQFRSARERERDLVWRASGVWALFWLQ